MLNSKKSIRPPRNHSHNGACKADLTALPESERNILTLTGARLLMATAAPHVYEAVTAVFSCADHEFTAKGKAVIAAGWKEIERLSGDPQKEAGQRRRKRLALDVPDFSEGQTFENPAAKVTEHATTPRSPTMKQAFCRLWNAPGMRTPTRTQNAGAWYACHPRRRH